MIGMGRDLLYLGCIKPKEIETLNSILKGNMINKLVVVIVLIILLINKYYIKYYVILCNI